MECICGAMEALLSCSVRQFKLELQLLNLYAQSAKLYTNRSIEFTIKLVIYESVEYTQFSNFEITRGNTHVIGKSLQTLTGVAKDNSSFQCLLIVTRVRNPSHVKVLYLLGVTCFSPFCQNSLSVCLHLSC